MASKHKVQPRVQVTPGKSVQILREVQNLSQRELARAVGVPSSTIAEIELGRIYPATGLAASLAKALKCHPSML